MATELATQRPETASTRRDEWAIAFFGAWMMIGLFLDGWAHQAGKPETFFTPWHGVLYSGFGAAVGFYTFMGWRERREFRIVQPNTDRLVLAGLAVFTLSAFGDFAWHALFGIEVDLETLLSLSHLGLMVGGMLMVTGPIRMAYAREDERTPTFTRFFPTLVCITLATALASFFLMYLSAFSNPDVWHFSSSTPDEGRQVGGVATILTTNALLVGAMLFVARRWKAPSGSFVLLFGVVALMMTGLSGFDHLALVLSAVVAGLAVEVLIERGSSMRTIALCTPLVLWSGWYAVYHIVWGLRWPADLWMGTIVLATMSGLGLSLLAAPPVRTGAQSLDAGRA